MQAQDVRVFYGEHQAIKGIDLELMENEVIAFIGPSGCGKSTFLRSFNRMNDTIDGCRLEGRILLDGEDIHAADMDVVMLRARVGMVFQKPNPFPKSIFDNVAYGPRIHGLARNKTDLDEIVVSSLRKAGLFGSREVQIDLDASAVMFAGGQPADVVFYNHLRSDDGSVQHSGDNRTGQGEGDDEVIMVDLPRVPGHVDTIAFIVTSYEGHTFEQVQNAFTRLVDHTTNAELARFTLSGGKGPQHQHTGMVMAKVYRQGQDWKLQALGEPMQARTPSDAMGQLTRLL